MTFYLLVFAITLVLSICFTIVVKYCAIKFNIIDQPIEKRKIHQTKTPLLGGLGIFFSFFIVAFFIRDKLLSGDLEFYHWLGVFIGACFLMIGGFLDDKFNLKPKQQIIWPILAGLAVIAGGVEIEKITNPFGGFLYLNIWEIPVFEWGNRLHYFVMIADIFTFIWLMGMIYTTKLLDGIDGLVTSITAIGAIIIFLFTMTTKYYQPDIGLAALILAAACLGFLVFNWHPAKIFLGEGGSLLLGFILGVLSIISGGKIAIALLIMGIPIMDVLWTIIRRLTQRKNPFKFADKEHLHFKLLDLGLSARKTVLLYCLFSLIFGLSALFLQSKGKLMALSVLILIMLAVVGGFIYLDKRKKVV